MKPTIVESEIQVNNSINVIAGMFQFKTAELLQSTESAEEREVRKVSFG